MAETLDQITRKARGYGLGERNPATLPTAAVQNESQAENERRSRYWRTLGRIYRHRVNVVKDRARA